VADRVAGGAWEDSTVTAKNVVILGSTGSIGRQALDVLAAHPERWKVVALVAGANASELGRQVGATGAGHSGLGEDAAVEFATLPEADIVLNAIVGAAGLRASVAALRAGKVLALANKESLVAGGAICADAAAGGGGTIVPVDSEHAAIAQAMRGGDRYYVRRIVLTASGGPFRTRSDLTAVSVDEALAHPTWSMGPKITVDSATMMNKGLEVIEAHFLFGLDYDSIDVIVHPQSVVHGIVEWIDGSMIMQAAPADMRIPIQAALAFPERLQPPFERVDLGRVAELCFEEVDHERFPCVGLAYAAGRRGGSYPAVLNAANEEAVNAFLIGLIPFTAISTTIEEVLELHDGALGGDLETLLEIDAWARSETRRIVRDQSASTRSALA
jgi:1-deoxy-D-xylulose-5-phosphate reductoisomerase